jgi:hypothetical protein
LGDFVDGHTRCPQTAFGGAARTEGNRPAAHD